MIYYMDKYGFILFGTLGFSFTLLASLNEVQRSSDELFLYIPYGIFIFFLNLIYIKIILISREDYEEKLRSEKLYSQELLESQKLFLRNAVHETNTPLSVIMANIELFELENERNDVLSNIEAATKNIYGIYDDLSYLTKKDRVNYFKKVISFSRFIESRVQFFNIVAQQSRVFLEFCDNSIDAKLYINETKLQRIIDNNITNAIKYTRENETIHLLLFQTKEHYVFEIYSHSSIVKNPEKIFTAYYRESKSTNGLGIGLNLVKTICDEEGIKIELNSDEDTTSFKFYFHKDIQ